MTPGCRWGEKPGKERADFRVGMARIRVSGRSGQRKLKKEGRGAGMEGNGHDGGPHTVPGFLTACGEGQFSFLNQICIQVLTS